MSDFKIETLVADLIEGFLNSAIQYNALRRQAEAEGRRLAMSDVVKLQAELKSIQARLDEKIAAMPEDEPPAG